MKFRLSKLINFLFILSACLPLVHSQQIEITKSRPDVNLGSTSVHKIIGHDQDHFYVIKYHGNQYHFEKLDKDLNFMLEEPIKLFEGIRTFDLETVVHFYNELYIFVSRRRFNDIVLYYQKIDKESLQPATDLIELTTISFISGNWAHFNFALSRHETKLLVSCRISLLWTKVQFNEYYVFGEGLQLIWKRKDSFDDAGKFPSENEYVIDETGNVSILSIQKRESIISLFREVKNSYTIYRITNNGEGFNEYPVTLEDMYIRGIKMIGGENGELIVAGLYSEVFKSGMKGTMFFKIHPSDGRIYDNYLHKFDDGLLARLEELNEPILEKKEELIEYVVTDLVERDNGKYMLIAEQVFNQSYNTYNNLIVTCYETNGQVYWSQVVDKRQDFNVHVLSDGVELSYYRDYIIKTGANNQYARNHCSYALMAPLDETGIIIFYNDDIRNLNQTDKKRNFNKPRKSYVVAVAIDEFGNIYRQPVLRWQRKESYPEPIRFYDTLRNSIVIPAFRNNKFNYYKITADFGQL